MGTKNRRIGQVVAGAALGLTVLALAGCAHDAKASNLEPPAIVWEDGEPTGEFWDSDWAGAYLEAEIQLSAARAHADFSDPAFVAAFGYDIARSIAEGASDVRFNPESSQYKFYELAGVYAYWGAIISIDEAPDGRSAIVSACEFAVQGGETLVPVPQHFMLTRADDGTYTADWGAQYGVDKPDIAKACGDAKIWVAKWATPIDIDDVGRDTVKMPLPRDYYIDLGVITQ